MKDSSPGWCRPSALPARTCNLQPSVHLVPPVTFILHPVPSPAEERESLAMRIQQVLNQCQTNEGGREASSPAHTLHLRADRKGVGSQEWVMGVFRVYQGHRPSKGLLEVGGRRGQLGSLSKVPPPCQGSQGSKSDSRCCPGLPGWAQTPLDPPCPG